MALLDAYTHLPEAAGIALQLSADGSISISCCQLRREGPQLHFTQKLPELANLEALQKALPAKVPVALNLSGKGILLKQLESTEIITEATFSSLLPNASYSDFYVQQYITGNRSFFALIRRQEADKWLNRIQGLGYECLSLSLNGFPVAAILPQLNNYGDMLIAAGHEIRFDTEKQWSAYRYDPALKADFPIKVDQEVIDERLLVPYAAAFGLLLSPKLPLIEAPVPALQESQKEQLALRKLKAKGIVALGTFFILLLINFALLTYFTQDNKQLSHRVGLSNQSTTNRNQLEQDIKSQQALLQELGWETGLSKAGRIDQLAGCLPQGVSWQQVAVNPPELKGDQQIPAFTQRTIRITGISAQLLPVNEWIARIQLRPWVKRVQLENYNYNPEEATGEFHLTISY